MATYRGTLARYLVEYQYDKAGRLTGRTDQRGEFVSCVQLDLLGNREQYDSREGSTYYFLRELYTVEGLVDNRGHAERSEGERAATGKAGMGARVRRATCPQRVSTKRTSGGAERYTYDAYGKPMIWSLKSEDINSDGTVDATDLSRLFGAYYNACVAPPADINGDGQVDPTDLALLLGAWGSDTVVSEIFHSKNGNPYAFTGRRMDFFDYQGDPEPVPLRMLYHYRAREYDPGHGRFMQRDPAGYPDGMNLYEYIKSRPTVLVDPSGLRNADCKKSDCCDLPEFQDEINRHITRIIQNGRAKQSNDIYDSRNLDILELHLWWELARPKTNDFLVIGESAIERWLTNQDKYLERKGILGKSTLAPCMNIACGKVKYCVGTDKIGHFFQQGYMMFEIRRELGREYALAFGDWTEGFYQEGRPGSAEIDKWLQDGSFCFRWMPTFYAEKPDRWGVVDTGRYEKKLKSFHNKWGGAIYAAPSAGDRAANRAGMDWWIKQIDFADKSPRSFDICDWISADWETD